MLPPGDHGYLALPVCLGPDYSLGRFAPSSGHRADDPGEIQELSLYRHDRVRLKEPFKQSHYCLDNFERLSAHSILCLSREDDSPSRLQ